MNPGRLSKAERTLWNAFPRGEPVDLSGVPDRKRIIRAEVITALLLGAAPAEPGCVAALRLEGARVTGTLRLGHAQLAGPMQLRHCEFDTAIDLPGARIRDLDLGGSRLAGLNAPRAEIGGSLNLSDSACTGQVILTGAHITGTLQADDSRVDYPGGVAVHASRLAVDDDLFLPRSIINGQLRLAGARVGGVVLLDKTVIRAGDGHLAVYAVHLSVGIRLLARDGFTAFGEVALNGAVITANADFRGAVFTNPGGDALVANGAEIRGQLSVDGCSAQGTIRLSHVKADEIYCYGGRFLNPGINALSCRYTEARALMIGQGLIIEGTADFRYSRFTLIRDDLSCWPGQLRLSGLGYDTLDPPLSAAQRVEWLRRDADGFLPKTYETLATMYRRAGDDAAARTVLLAREREHRRQLPWYGRAWSLLQDATVGYGYRPLRAGAWLMAFLVLGTLVFGLHRPPALVGAPHPAFNPLIYTLDLLVPVVNFGLRNVYAPQGPQRWLAYALISVGWIFATTIAAGLARVLRRQ